MADEVVGRTVDGVMVITRNALSVRMRAQLRDAWEHFERDAASDVAILTAEGPVFCAGMDLAEAAEVGLQVPPPDFLPIVGETVHVSKPTIAAVNGPAIAGGWLLAQMCDLCVATETASFAITEARVGRGMPWAAPWVRMLPPRVVMELLLTGAPLSAERAYHLGFVNRIVPPEALLAAAHELATTIRGNAPLTVRAARRMVYLAQEMGRTASRAVADALFEPVYRSADAQEGPRACRERRPPRWRGE